MNTPTNHTYMYNHYVSNISLNSTIEKNISRYNISAIYRNHLFVDEYDTY